MEIEEIGYIRTDYKEKFGIPRQSLLVDNARGIILFNNKFKNKEALRGLLEYSYIWVLWIFDVEVKDNFVPKVRPPKLGGNEYMGVFATRSPFRPNRIGMSSLKLKAVYNEYEYPDGSTGPAIEVLGVDLLDGTKIIDIKPYLEYVDSHVGAGNGFVKGEQENRLRVQMPDALREELSRQLGETELNNITDIISLDPRPSYHNDADRIYGFIYKDMNIKFRVEDNVACMTDCQAVDCNKEQ